MKQTTDKEVNALHTPGDNYEIVLWEDNVYYRASKRSYWTHTVNNRRIYDNTLTEELNKAAQAKNENLVNDVKALREALENIEALEKAADSSVYMVDVPHTKALRAACKCAREALSQTK